MGNDGNRTIISNGLFDLCLVGPYDVQSIQDLYNIELKLCEIFRALI
jgi:hypothetical protein